MTSLYDLTRFIITLNLNRITGELDTILYNTFLQYLHQKSEMVLKFRI